jgi:hypothetical protein
MLHKFETEGGGLRLWQQRGESYEHVLMKALGYAMHVEEFQGLEVERPVGMRYKPDLIAVGAGGEFDFWGECGLVTVRKTIWLAKHSGAKRVTLFKTITVSSSLRSSSEPRSSRNIVKDDAWAWSISSVISRI